LERRYSCKHFGLDSLFLSVFFCFFLFILDPTRSHHRYANLLRSYRLTTRHRHHYHRLGAGSYSLWPRSTSWLTNERPFHVHTIAHLVLFLFPLYFYRKLLIWLLFCLLDWCLVGGRYLLLFSFLPSRRSPSPQQQTSYTGRTERVENKRKESDVRDHRPSKHTHGKDQNPKRIGCIYSIFTCVVGRLGVSGF